MKKFLSTGGIGDLFIIALKLQEWLKNNPNETIDWLHVESTNITNSFFNIVNMVCLNNLKNKFDFEHDPNYIENFKQGKWSDRESIPVSLNRECALHKKYWPIENPFLVVPECEEKVYDVCIQVSARQRNNKEWLFNPINFADMLSRNFNYKVCLIGNDERFKPEKNVHSSCFKIEKDVINEVCKYQNLSLAIQSIWKSKVFIGLSGFLNYFACAIKIPNIHVIEGKDQEADYYHYKWKDLTYGIKLPTLQDVMRGINHYRGVGVL